jgi:hypothetical protein
VINNECEFDNEGLFHTWCERACGECFFGQQSPLRRVAQKQRAAAGTQISPFWPLLPPKKLNSKVLLPCFVLVAHLSTREMRVHIYRVVLPPKPVAHLAKYN